MTADALNVLYLFSLFMGAVIFLCGLLVAAQRMIHFCRVRQQWSTIRRRHRRLTKQERQDRLTQLQLQAKRDASVDWLGDDYVFAPKKTEEKTEEKKRI